MKRLVIAAVLLFPLVLRAQPACPSVQWTLGTPMAGFGVSTYVREVAAIDYDEDGKLDLVGVIDENTIRHLVWFKGNGDNTFGVATTILSSLFFTNIIVADATGDGRDDVVVGNIGNQSILILPGTGSGRGPAISNPLTMSPLVIFAVNRDADAAVELYVSGGSSHAFAVYDDIATTATELAKVTRSSTVRGIVSADFDGDGRFDVAISSTFDQPGLDVYFGKADGTYDPPMSLPFVTPWDLSVADLDEDGRPDLLAGNWETDNSWREGTVSIYMNEGGRTFTNSTLLLDIPGRRGDINAMVITDVSGDGHLDLIAGGSSSGSYTATAIGLGDGTFRSPTFLSPSDPMTPISLAAGDFTGDGKLELAIGTVNALYPAAGACTTQVHLYAVSPVISEGQEASLPAHVSGFGSDTPLPRGTLTLRDGATVLDTLTVGADGKALFTIPGLTLGMHSLTAEFSGNSAVAAATSLVVPQQVTSDTTETTIALPPDPMVYGQAMPIQITIVNGSADWVKVNLDGVILDHYTGGPLNLPIEPGAHTISAKYYGSIFKPPSESEPVAFNVAKGTPTMSNTGALAVRVGSAHSLTFTVNGSGATGPGGSVQLIEGTTVLASGALVNGSATFNMTLTRGAHEVRAVYSGDSRYLGLTQNYTLEVIPNALVAIEARGLPGGIHIAYVLPNDTNMSTLQMLRRPVGSPTFVPIAWNATTGMDTSVPLLGVGYQYQLNLSLNNGTPLSSNMDSALLFTDDLLAAGIVIKRAHFSELRSAINLLRAQASLTPFEFDASYNASSIVRASHLSGLRTALTQARQTLGMSVPTFSGGGIGTLIQASHIQELRELAR